MTQRIQRMVGCGCAAVLVILLVVSVVAWSLSFMGKSVSPRTLGPVPDNVPPQLPQAVAEIDVHAAGRTADKLTYWSKGIAEQTEISGQALRAYGNAELIARDSWPDCHLHWNTLAGIGWVETRHGTYTGKWHKPSQLDENGYPTPEIHGIPLDGTNGTAEIPDTDNGEIDGDAEHDRAVGPMQFIPSSWRINGNDANGDGIADPKQIDDAALGAAKLLCSDGRDLSTEQGWMAAILAYNASNDYVRRVANAANSYAVGQPATS